MSTERPTLDPYEKAQDEVQAQWEAVDKDRKRAGEIRRRANGGDPEPDDRTAIDRMCRDYGVAANAADRFETLRLKIDEARELLTRIKSGRGNGSGSV